jgi:tripartite ATP-independent transporter DctP family solute receptor
MKKMFVSALILLMAFSLFAQGTTEGSSEAAKSSKQIVLKLSECHADGYPTALADKEFSRLVEERTEGRIKIEVYTGGTLYGEETGSIEALQAGDLAFSRVSAAPVASYVPALNAIQLPYLYKNSDHEWAVLDGDIGQKMLADIEASGSGLMGLCFYDSGCRSFYTTREMHTVADLKGLKIRMQNNPMMVKMVQLLGATAVTGIGPNDVYSAITQGVIDGAENNWPTYQNMGDYEAAKYYLLDGHTRVPEILLGSVAGLKKVSPSDLAIIKKSAKDTEEFEKAAWAKKVEESKKIVKDAGSILIDPTAAAVLEFQNAMKPLYGEYGKGYEDVIQQIQTIGMNY